MHHDPFFAVFLGLPRIPTCHAPPGAEEFGLGGPIELGHELGADSSLCLGACAGNLRFCRGGGARARPAKAG